MAIISKIPDDIIALILDFLPKARDLVYFSAVCKSWKSIVRNWKTQKKKTPLPPCLLMLTTSYELEYPDNGIQKFVNLSSKRMLKLAVPYPRGMCWGSPFGWLVTVDVFRYIHLLNPFTRIQLSLPHPSTFLPQWPPDELWGFMHKFVLSAAPALESDQSCIVIAIYSESRRLAFAKPGDIAWTIIRSPHTGFQDVLFSNGKCYAINMDGRIVCFDINTLNPETTDFAYPLGEIYYGDACEFYLVEMSGDLVVVERGLFGFRTTGFKVLWFDFHKCTWTEISDLDNHSLFLGNNTSYAVSSSDLPDLRPNCIYLTEEEHIYDCDRASYEMVVYDLKEGIMKPIFSIEDGMLSDFLRLVFIVPTL